MHVIEFVYPLSIWHPRLRTPDKRDSIKGSFLLLRSLTHCLATMGCFSIDSYELCKLYAIESAARQIGVSVMAYITMDPAERERRQGMLTNAMPDDFWGLANTNLKMPEYSEEEQKLIEQMSIWQELNADSLEGLTLEQQFNIYMTDMMMFSIWCMINGKQIESDEDWVLVYQEYLDDVKRLVKQD